MSAVATKVAIVALAAIICVCGSSICYMGKQPDPNHPELGLRWVLPYTKEVLCTCTKILFGGTNMEPPPGSENCFYPDDPMSLVNNDDAKDLRAKLKCVEKNSKGKVAATNHQSTRTSLPASLSSSTSSPPTKAQGTTGSSPATVASSTSSTPTKAQSTTGSSPTTVDSSTSSTPTKAQSTTGSSPTTVDSPISSTTPKPQSTTVSSATTVAFLTSTTTTKAQSTTESSLTTVASSTSSTATKPQSTTGSSPPTVDSSTSSSTTKPQSTAALSTTPSPVTTSSTTENPQGADCEEILDQGHSNNGVYTLSPDFLNGGSLDVLCDMENGGWILIQQRFDGSVNFTQDWTSYRNGFGTPPGEHWLGLYNIKQFTRSGGTWKLRVDLEDWHGHTGYAEYSEFELKGADYELDVDGYNGSIGDAMEYHDDGKFSTPDPENSDGDCASHWRSGWWFKDYCHEANLNGVYFHTYEVQPNEGIQWKEWTTDHEEFNMDEYSMKSASMKIKKA